MLGVGSLRIEAPGYWRGGTLLPRDGTERQTRAALARNLFIGAVLYGVWRFPLEGRAIGEKSPPTPGQ